MSTNEPAQKMSKGDSSQRAQFGQKPLGSRKPGRFGNLLHVEMGGQGSRSDGYPRGKAQAT